MSDVVKDEVKDVATDEVSAVSIGMEEEVFDQVFEDKVEEMAKLFSNMSIDQIDELQKAIRSKATEAKKVIRAKIRAAEKKAAAEEKERLTAENSEKLENVVEGTEVTILVGSGSKAEAITGTFVKKTAKRFTVLIDGVKKSVMFHRLVSINEAEEVAEDTEDFIDDDFSSEDLEDVAL